ncbi:MAG: hypothetical protein ABJL99_26800 [Aliishimia sp.]
MGRPHISHGSVVSVQNEFLLRYRADADIVTLTAKAGMAYLPWTSFGEADRAH